MHSASPSPTTLYRIPCIVGIAGHRDLVPEQVPAIRAAIRVLLSSLQSVDPDVPIQLLCPMADGADLLAAEVADELGIAVLALLTFPEPACRADLSSEAARLSFDRIMSRAERLELPALTADGGTPRDLQFQRAGLVLARYCSVLIAVWDGRPTDYPAGTARVVEFRQRGIRLAEDRELEPADLLLSAHDNDLIYDIRCARIDGAANVDPAAVEVRGFTGHDVDPAQGRELPTGLLTLLARTADFNRDVSDHAADITASGQPLGPPSPFAVPETVRKTDQLFVQADVLGSLFRRSFLRAIKIRYALWAAMAFFLLAFKKASTGATGLGVILAVLGIFAAGSLLANIAHRRKWHRKFLDYRALAEALRVDYYWEIAGVRRRFAGEFAHESFLQKQDSDLEWIRAAMRAVSLRAALQPNAPTTLGFAQTYAGWIGDDAAPNSTGQLRYYQQRSAGLRNRLHGAERIDRVLLLLGTAIAASFVVDISASLSGFELLPGMLREGLLWALALLTVYAAIFEIYLAEKADRSLVRQYRYMHKLFRFAAQELKSARSESDKLEILRSLGHACLAEHAQWILAQRDKTLQGLKW